MRKKIFSLDFFCLILFVISLFFALTYSSVWAKGYLSYPCKNCSNNICPIGPPGTGGGDLADSNALSVGQIACFLDKKGSPWVDSAADVKAAAVEFNVSPSFMLAIAGQESTWGKSGPSSIPVMYNNPGDESGAGFIGACNEHGISTQGVGDQNVIIFGSMHDGWRAMALALRISWLDKGATTVEQVHDGNCPQGCGVYATDPRWADNIESWMQEAASCNN